jgi:hypothetical protein
MQSSTAIGNSNPWPQFLGRPARLTAALAPGPGPGQGVRGHLHSCIQLNCHGLLGPYCFQSGAGCPDVVRSLPPHPLPAVSSHGDLRLIQGVVPGPNPPSPAWPSCYLRRAAGDFLWQGRFERLAHDELHAPLSMGFLKTSAIQSKLRPCWPSRPATAWRVGSPCTTHSLLGWPSPLPPPPQPRIWPPRRGHPALLSGPC